MESYSVLLPVYHKDNPEWLKIAVDSMVKQTLPPEEIVIAVDGPVPEKLSALIKTFETDGKLFSIYRFEQNEGLGPLLQKTVPLCRNRYIARMDADDYSMPERCQKQMQFLSENGDFGIVGCIIGEFESDAQSILSIRKVPESFEQIVRYSKRRNPINHPTVMCRKQDILDSGNYSGDYPLLEDYDLWVRMMKNGIKAHNIQETLYAMRTSGGFTARRGGRAYLKTQLRFAKYMYKSGWSGFADYAARSMAFMLTCLVPDKLRGMIYKKLLRKESV